MLNSFFKARDFLPKRFLQTLILEHLGTSFKIMSYANSLIFRKCVFKDIS